MARRQARRSEECQPVRLPARIVTAVRDIWRAEEMKRHWRIPELFATDEDRRHHGIPWWSFASSINKPILYESKPKVFHEGKLNSKVLYEGNFNPKVLYEGKFIPKVLYEGKLNSFKLVYKDKLKSRL